MLPVPSAIECYKSNNWVIYFVKPKRVWKVLRDQTICRDIKHVKTCNLSMLQCCDTVVNKTAFNFVLLLRRDVTEYGLFHFVKRAREFSIWRTWNFVESYSSHHKLVSAIPELPLFYNMRMKKRKEKWELLFDSSKSIVKIKMNVEFHSILFQFNKHICVVASLSFNSKTSVLTWKKNLLS